MQSFKLFTVVEDHQKAILDGTIASPISLSRQMNSKSERLNPFSVLIEPLLLNGNVTVVDSALVERVVIEDKTARGVVFSVEGAGARFVSARQEVILCGGSINSAQLLMLSGIGPKEQLSRLGLTCIADLPVGQGLIDHPFAVTAAELKQAGPPTDGSFLDCTGFYKSEWSRKNEPNRGRDMQVKKN